MIQIFFFGILIGLSIGLILGGLWVEHRLLR